MNSCNNNPVVKDRPKNKGFKGTPKRNKKTAKCLSQQGQKIMIKQIHNFHSRKSCFILAFMSELILLLVLRIKTPMFVSSTQLCRFYFSFQNYIEQSSYDNQVASLISGLLEDIQRSSTSNNIKNVQNLRLSKYVFFSQHDTHECVIYIVECEYIYLNIFS